MSSPCYNCDNNMECWMHDSFAAPGEFLSASACQRGFHTRLCGHIFNRLHDVTSEDHENHCSEDQCRYYSYPGDCTVSTKAKAEDYITSLSDDEWSAFLAKENIRRVLARRPVPPPPPVRAVIPGTKFKCFGCDHDFDKHNGGGIGACTESVPETESDYIASCGCDGHPNNVLFEGVVS